jgi:hypothetical protein
MLRKIMRQDYWVESLNQVDLGGFGLEGSVQAWRLEADVNGASAGACSLFINQFGPVFQAGNAVTKLG